MSHRHLLNSLDAPVLRPRLPPPLPVQANEILHHKLTLNGYLAEFTGQSMDTITADTDRDFFMSAQEAVRRAAQRLLAVTLPSSRPTTAALQCPAL